jgi:tetratricopeptide (TPR) repeat protein
VDFDNAIGILEAFSFVTADEMGTTYSIHRIVQAATRAWLADQQDCTSKNIASQALQMLSSRFPDGEFENWTTCARYLPHAESVLSRGFDDRSETDSLARAKLLSMVAKYLRKQGNFSLAKAKARESLDIYQTIRKPDCADALQVSTEFATIIGYMGDTEGAIRLYRETLKIQENLLGKDHLDTLETVMGLASELADTMMHPDDHKEAELLARRALVGREKALPTNHPKILASIHRLGWSVYRLRRYSEAEILFRKCKTQREIVLGELHPDTCATTTALALALDAISKPEEAEKFLRHSAKITSMLCGVEHHDAIIRTGNLGSFLTEYVILTAIPSCASLFWVMRHCFTVKVCLDILQP